MSLVVLGHYRLCSYWELHLALRCAIRSMVSCTCSIDCGR